MWVRRGFYRWLPVAALALPVWLLIAWAMTNAGALAFLWVLFLAIPAVFLGELVLTLLVRARPTARVERAASWWDVGGIGVWQVMVVGLGFFSAPWWPALMVFSLFAWAGLIWLQLWQLFRERTGAQVLLHASDGTAYVPPATRSRPAADAPAEGMLHEVIVVQERPRADG